MTPTPRLDSVRNLGLEAMPDRDLFSRITVLASTMLGCPISLLSVVEEDRQWFLGRSGTDLVQTPIDASLCALCVRDEAPLLVHDARNDPQLADKALVTGPPFIRSYIGVPVRGEDGTVIGALCGISPEAGAFRADQIAMLAMLAELAEQSIALHTRTRALSDANAGLRQQTRIFRQAERAVNIGSWWVDLATRKLHWSDQVFAIAGLQPSPSINVRDVVQLYQPEDRPLVSAAMDDTIDGGKPFVFETTIHRRDGEVRRIRMVGERIDVDGRPDYVAGIILDCTEEHLRNAALQRAAERDRLTGLFNRASFDRKLADAMQQASTEPVTVALLDLDGFKDINDTLGHLVGDRVLETIAAQLQLHASEGVFLARWGGDEFAMMFPAHMGLSGVTRFLERLLGELGDIPPLGASQLRIGATCGVARMSEAASSEEIMRRADLALYRGKDEGRGSVVWWDQQIEARQSERQQAIARLRSALGSGRALAAYQPIIALDTGRVVAVEALLRLRA